MTEIINAETGRPDPATQVCKELDIKYLLPLQELAILSMLEIMDSGKFDNKNLFCLFPTGMGKTICFLALVLLKRCLAIIVYPLNALVADQERRIEAANIPVAVLTGVRSKEERKKDLTRLGKEGWGVIICNPETLKQPSSLDLVSKLGPSLMIIDEVHLVEEWGSDFRPAFYELGTIRKRLEIENLFCFTATLSEEALQKVKETLLIDRPPKIVRAPLDRSNLFFRTAYTAAPELLIPLLFVKNSGIDFSDHVELPAVVFCPTRKRTEQMANALSTVYKSAERFGHEVPDYREIRFYHAGLNKEQRKELELWFAKSDSGILCCTCAYGTGVDKKNIRTVIHSFAPPSPQAYVQESGRAGRDGKQATGILLRTRAETPDWVARYTKGGECRRSFLTSVLNDELEGCSGCESCLGQHGLTNLDFQLIRACKHFLGKPWIEERDLGVFRGSWPLSKLFLSDKDMQQWGLLAAIFDNVDKRRFANLLKSSRLSGLVDNEG